MNRKWLRVLLTIVITAVILRMFLPFVALTMINHLLKNKLGNYTGHVEDLDISLWRGAYHLQEFKIRKNNSQLPPLIAIKEIDLSMVRTALFRKEIAADITLLEPNLNLIGSSKKEEQQTGAEESVQAWQSVFKTIVPIHIESLKIVNGTIQFLNYNFKEPIPIKIDQLNISALDLRSRAKELESPFALKGRVQGHAELKADGKINIMVSPPQGDFDFSFVGFKMASINAHLHSYVPIDITSGELSLYGELASRDRNGIGYIKIFFKDGDIISPSQSFKGPKHVLIELASAFSNWLLKNRDSKSIATEIPIEIKAGRSNISAAQAFWEALKNRSEELKPEIDNRIGFSSLNTDKK